MKLNLYGTKFSLYRAVIRTKLSNKSPPLYLLHHHHPLTNHLFSLKNIWIDISHQTLNLLLTQLLIIPVNCKKEGIESTLNTYNCILDTHAKSSQDLDTIAPTADKTTYRLKANEGLKYASTGELWQFGIVS